MLKQKPEKPIDRDIDQSDNEQLVVKRVDNNPDAAEEMRDTPSYGGREYYLLYNERKIFIGKLILTKPGEVVHHHTLHSSERKFEVTRVIDCNTPFWEEFDEDIHSVGSYIAWDLRNSLVKTKVRHPVEGLENVIPKKILEKYKKHLEEGCTADCVEHCDINDDKIYQEWKVLNNAVPEESTPKKVRIRKKIDKKTERKRLRLEGK